MDSNVDEVNTEINIYNESGNEDNFLDMEKICTIHVF